jgi:hypothetical protein
MPKAKKKSPAAHLPKHSPRKTGKRGIGPRDDAEPLETAAAPQETQESEEEQLITPQTPKKARKPRQPRLPEMEDPAIEELESAAEEYASVRDRRMALTEDEVAVKEELLDLMHRHNKTKYFHNGVEIRVVPSDETVKVKISKDR